MAQLPIALISFDTTTILMPWVDLMDCTEACNGLNLIRFPVVSDVDRLRESLFGWAVQNGLPSAISS